MPHVDTNNVKPVFGSGVKHPIAVLSVGQI